MFSRIFRIGAKMEIEAICKYLDAYPSEKMSFIEYLALPIKEIFAPFSAITNSQIKTERELLEISFALLERELTRPEALELCKVARKSQKKLLNVENAKTEFFAMAFYAGLIQALANLPIYPLEGNSKTGKEYRQKLTKYVTSANRGVYNSYKELVLLLYNDNEHLLFFGSMSSGAK